MIIKPKTSDEQRLAQLFRNRPTKTRDRSMSEFSETTTVTAGPRKGEKFQLAYAPYLRKPMELMSPGSIIQQIFLMFPAQSAKSVFVQLCCGFYGLEVPSEMIYATSDLNQARNVSQRRLEVLFRSIGLKFRTQSENKGSRRTGDVLLSKEFDGGNIDVGTAGSSAFLASETKRIGIGDELDRWKLALGVEGSPWAQLYARLKAWGDEKKAVGVSTPTDEDVSLIYALYLTGTQDEWEMPCPLCGKHQILEVKNKSGYGLDYKTRNENVIKSSIVYVCKHCTDSFKEIHKFDMLQDGLWMPHPTATPPDDELTASFHITALNSMFESWFEVAKGYESGLESQDKRKEFQNLTMGWPFKEVGSRPKASVVMENKGNYQAGSVPDGVIGVVSAGDVQRGSDRWRDMPEDKLEEEIAAAILKGTAHEKKFPRLEFEWMGFGPGYRTWSIMYKVFYGRTDYAFSGAWEKLNNYAIELQEENGFYGFLRQDGHMFPVVKTLIDSGYNPDVSYMFSQRWGSTFISKGAKEIPAPKNTINVNRTADNFLKYRIGKSTSVPGANFYEIGTKRYKQLLYGSLKNKRLDHDIQLPGFQDFPINSDIYNLRYFEMLTSEEKLVDGNYNPGSRPNEALDCRVGCMCASDAYIHETTELAKQKKRETGEFSQLQINKLINHKAIIMSLSKSAGIDKRYNEVPDRKA